MNMVSQIIYIVEDNAEIAHALRFFLEEAQFCVEVFSSADSFLRSSVEKKQGCLIVDVRMPGMSGLELLEQLKKKNSYLPVIVITAYGDIPMVVRAIKAGANDFILKPFDNHVLLEAIHKCLQQSSRLSSLQETQERFKLLTERERQMLELILDGKLNKQIAYELSISISTVEAHRAHIMDKMQANNLAHLIKLYLYAQQNRSLTNID